MTQVILVTLKNRSLKENVLGAPLGVPGIGFSSISNPLDAIIKNTNHQLHEKTTIPATIPMHEFGVIGPRLMYHKVPHYC